MTRNKYYSDFAMKFNQQSDMIWQTGALSSDDPFLEEQVQMPQRQIYLDDKRIHTIDLGNKFILATLTGYRESRVLYHTCGRWFGSIVSADHCVTCGEEAPRKAKIETLKALIDLKGKLDD